jgi:2-succinyl-6-hydroxy-2,4-cyclohexadiene-1-carboxylate synthase
MRLPTEPTWATAATALANAGGHGIWVGYSLGGRLALQIALDRPELVERLVLVSTSAGIETDAERTERGDRDEALATSIEVDGVDVFLDRWLAQPLFERIPNDAAGIAERRAQSASTLASQLRVLGVAAMPNLWPRLDEITMPITVATGRHDAKFTTIGDRLAAACTRSNVSRVEFDSGHAIPLEVPDFLRRVL